MPIAMSSSKLSIAIAAILISSGTALAQAAPDTENGRYALSPAGDGFLRLDTRTGAVSTCTNSSAGWACYMVPDERAALDAEIGRLQADNDKLKGELAARAPSAKTDEALPKSDQLKKPEPKTQEPKVAEGERKIEIPLPSDRDMDRMMSFVERAWRRLIEMANRVQRDVNGGKI
ncbi:hypothetical protein QMZ05_28285 [Bradyrhizobium sp. INPA03-11B]|uniref:hypothetical protein n=1 Tax=Bradyrhizobium sp. INPA03-11B TaxID=418598 RepID=UPI00338ED022